METDRATEFAKKAADGIVDGRVIGKSEKLSALRHLRDLQRQNTEEFPFAWVPEKAYEMQGFAENLTLVEGDDPAPLNLKGFQAFILGSWHGWRHVETGYRRFKTSYAQEGRQNGKSIMNAVPSLFYGNFAGYQYPQIYTVATKELQAKIVLKECYKFINADPELAGTKTRKGLFTIRDYRSEIECNLTGGIIKALGRDTESIDGFRPYFGSVDEYHKHKTNQMYKLLADGARNMKEYLISVITTAGFDLNCPCKELYDYCRNILYGAWVDESQFVYIAELDEDDQKGEALWNEENWGKPNPLWTSQMQRNLHDDGIKAREMGGQELVNFETKSLNIWVQAMDDRYIDVEKWNACASDTTLEDMRGRECYLGLDLSSGGDLTSGGLEFPFDVDGTRKYFIDSHSFMPKARLEEHEKTDRAPYRLWVQKNLITLTETLGGLKTDYKYILQYYADLIKKLELRLRGIGYDPHNADAFLADLDTFGCDLVMITQSARNLNDPTSDFKLEVDAGNVIYDRKNTLLTWSMINARKVKNSFGEIKLEKDLARKRIDPCDAVIDAHKLALANKPVIDVSQYADNSFLAKLWGLSH